MFAIMTDRMVNLCRVFGKHSRGGQGALSSIGVLATAMLFVVLPWDISQLVLALAGTLAYALLQTLWPRREKQLLRKSVPIVTPEKSLRLARNLPVRSPTKSKSINNPHPRTLTMREIRTPSSAPIAAPNFQSAEWESQISELLGQISPSQKDDEIVGKLAWIARRAIKSLIPEVEVVGFASGDLLRKKAFGVAVPEVDIIANASPEALTEALRGRFRSGGQAAQRALDPRKLQKAAIRACTDTLVAGGFKFRRSAFRSEEPKVTLLAPATFGLCEDAIAIDFSVNAATPLYNATLLTECGQMEARGRDLILLVKRWAKDRGVCHAAKGHLPPYAWTLLAIFFLQSRKGEGGALLPPLVGFEMASSLAQKNGIQPLPFKGCLNKEDTSKVSIGALFKEFVQFYDEFQWQSYAVSLHEGHPEKPSLKLPINIIVHDDGTSSVGPSVEDPFDVSRNLGSSMSSASYHRLKEELARVQAMCSANVSLADILEPWAPAEPDSSELTPTEKGNEDERVHNARSSGVPDALA